MNIVQITAGAGGMFCGGCFRDNALVGVLRKMGHSATMIPVYLPLTLEEEDQSEGTPIFFGGISVYLEQKFPIFAKAPRWIHRLLASPALLRWAAGGAAKTRAEDLGELTLSMLEGKKGRQAAELEVLIDWLKEHQKPEIICLSNALLAGMARGLKQELNVPVVCTFQGEDSFLNTLPEPYRSKSWQALEECAKDIDLFISPSGYFGELMRHRLKIPPEKLKVVFNGINVEGYGPSPQRPSAPVLGFFARMCREKGLADLVESWMILKQRPQWKSLRLHVGGGCGPGDIPLVSELKRKIRSQGWLNDVEFFPNLSRKQKQDFFRGLSVFSSPALYGEAFGLYVIEAMASGVPVVQPRHAAFPELIEATGGGLLSEPGKPESLANNIETLLANPEKSERMGQQGRQAVLERFTMQAMAQEIVKEFESLLQKT